MKSWIIFALIVATIAIVTNSVEGCATCQSDCESCQKDCNGVLNCIAECLNVCVNACVLSGDCDQSTCAKI